MSPQEFESHIVGAINAALKSRVPPAIIYTVLESHALDILMMLKSPPPPPEESPIILTPPR